MNQQNFCIKEAKKQKLALKRDESAEFLLKRVVFFLNTAKKLEFVLKRGEKNENFAEKG